MTANGFTLDDFMAQMGQVRKLGKVMNMIPGMSQLSRQMNMGEGDIQRQMRRMHAIYSSTTVAERDNPDLIDAARRRRIAAGAGVRLAEVGQFIRQFEQSRNMMQHVGSMGMGDKAKLLIGLVTDNQTDRDPSYVHPVAPPLPWWAIALLLGLLAVALLWLAR